MPCLSCRPAPAATIALLGGFLSVYLACRALKTGAIHLSAESFFRNFLTVRYFLQKVKTMLPRQLAKASQKQVVLLAAKKALKDRGYSYRNAAPKLQVHWSHLAKVLLGIRESKALIKRIHELPHR